MIPRETDPDLPMSVQEFLVEAWVGGGLLQVGGTEYSSACLGPFERGRHYLHYLHHSLILPREHTGHSKHPLQTTQEKTLHMVNTEIRLIIFFAAEYGEALYSQQKQD